MSTIIKNLCGMDGEMRPAHRKERDLDWHGLKVIATNGEIVMEAVDIRIYHTQSRAYACVWVRVREDMQAVLDIPRYMPSGSGYASGWGISQADAAVHEAMTSIGIQFHNWIPGQGAWREAAVEIAQIIYPGWLIHPISIYS